MLTRNQNVLLKSLRSRCIDQHSDTLRSLPRRSDLLIQRQNIRFWPDRRDAVRVDLLVGLGVVLYTRCQLGCGVKHELRIEETYLLNVLELRRAAEGIMVPVEVLEPSEG